MTSTNAISRIDRWLALHRLEYYRGLRVGVADAELDELESHFQLKLTEPFRELYRWRNGQAATNTDSLYGNRILLSVEEIVETKELLDDQIDSDFDDPSYWRRGWIPFLHNGGGSYLCLDLAAEDGGNPGQVIAFWKADQDRPIKFRSFEDWLVALAAAMDKANSRDELKFYS